MTEHRIVQFLVFIVLHFVGRRFVFDRFYVLYQLHTYEYKSTRVTVFQTFILFKLIRADDKAMRIKNNNKMNSKPDLQENK